MGTECAMKTGDIDPLDNKDIFTQCKVDACLWLPKQLSNVKN